MSERFPALCTLDDFDKVLSRETAGNTVNCLIEGGYAHRPLGQRKGATLTPKGQIIAAQIRR